MQFETRAHVDYSTASCCQPARYLQGVTCCLSCMQLGMQSASMLKSSVFPFLLALYNLSWVREGGISGSAAKLSPPSSGPPSVCPGQHLMKKGQV